MNRFPSVDPANVKSQQRILQQDIVSTAVKSNSIMYGGVQNPNINVPARASTAIVFPSNVSTSTLPLGSFNDIQRAIDYVNNLGGGSVLIRNGTYYPPDKITLYSNITLYGDSTVGTIIDFSQTTFLLPLFASIQGTGITMSLLGTYSITNGTKAVTGSSSKFVDDKVLPGDFFYIDGVPYQIFSITDNTHLVLVDTFHGNSLSGQSVRIERNLHDIYIYNLTVKNSVKDGIKLLRVVNGAIKFCNVINCVTAIAGDGYNIEVSENVAFNNSDSGFSIAGNSVNITRNYSANNGGIGISMGGRNVIISENFVANNDASGIFGSLLTDITIADNFVTGNDFIGIGVGVGSTRVIILGNNVGLSGDVSIKISGNVALQTTRVAITGNITHEEDGNALEFTTFADNSVATNNVFGNSVVNSGAGNTVTNNIT